MTIKAAKEMARKMNGGLPRCGREVLVLNQIEADKVTNWDGRIIAGDFRCK